MLSWEEIKKAGEKLMMVYLMKRKLKILSPIRILTRRFTIFNHSTAKSLCNDLANPFLSDQIPCITPFPFLFNVQEQE